MSLLSNNAYAAFNRTPNAFKNDDDYQEKKSLVDYDYTSGKSGSDTSSQSEGGSTDHPSESDFPTLQQSNSPKINALSPPPPRNQENILRIGFKKTRFPPRKGGKKQKQKPQHKQQPQQPQQQQPQQQPHQPQQQQQQQESNDENKHSPNNSPTNKHNNQDQESNNNTSAPTSNADREKGHIVGKQDSSFLILSEAGDILTFQGKPIPGDRLQRYAQSPS